MKLKSILIIAMVAIMAMAGGAFAATTTTNSTNTLDTPGFAGGVSLNFGGAICNSTQGAVVACAALTAAQSTAFVTDSQTGTGTGLTGGMPAQVTYAANQYTGGVGAATGYALSQTLFGMCAINGGVVGACPKFVPNPAIVNASGSALLLAQGGGTTGTIPGSTNLNPQGTLGAFNEATFLTGLVSGFTQAGLTNALSQKTVHHSLVTGGTGTNTDGDFIDQRLSQVTGGVQTLAQAVLAGGSSGSSVAITVDTGAQDPAWLLNVDGFGGPNYQNSGVVNQAIADSNSGGFGDYGQLFSNTDVSVVNNINPAPVPGPATIYNAISPIFGGVLGGTLP